MKSETVLIKEFKKKLNINLSMEDTVVLCGAGISIPSGLPSGYEIIQKMFSDLNFKEITGIDILNLFKQLNLEVIFPIFGIAPSLFNQPRLEVLFYAIKEALTKINKKEIYNRYIEYLFPKTSNPSCFHYILAEFIYKGGYVITSNFDELIEDAYFELYAEDCNTYIFAAGDIIGCNVISEKKGVLIKYHGTVSKPESIGIDIANISILGFKGQAKQTLSQIFENKKNILVLGHSMSDTLDLIPFLKKFKDKLNIIFVEYISTDNNEGNSLQLLENTSIERNSNLWQISFYLDIKNITLIRDYKNRFFTEIYDKYINTTKNETKKFIEEKNKNPLLNLKEEEKKILSLYILKTLGLIRLIEFNELKSIADVYNISKKELIDYYLNVQGKYFVKVSKNACSTLGSLNEAFFLGRNLIVFPLLITYFCKCYRLWENNHNVYCMWEWLLVYTRFHRVFRYKFVNTQKLDKLFSNLINLSERTNNLIIYRFAQKEYLIYKMKVNRKFFFENKKSFLELLIFNFDTNYFIEITNLLRHIYESTGLYKYPLVSSACITKDFLNLKKVLKLIEKKSSH